MSSCSPNPAETRHLAGVLHAYGRDELWLRVKRIYELPMQRAQFTADVTDATGAILRDAGGRERCHTFQMTSPNLALESGQRVRLARAGQSVQVQVLPQLERELASPGPMRWAGLRAEATPAT